MEGENSFEKISAERNESESGELLRALTDQESKELRDAIQRAKESAGV